MSSPALFPSLQLELSCCVGHQMGGERERFATSEDFQNDEASFTH